jgi:YNFM family putative membrane transporter
MAAGVVLTLLQPLAAIVAGIVLLTAGFFVAHSVASGWVGRLATQSKGHASSLYLWGYYMGSSVLGAGAGWFWSRWGWTGVGSVALAVLALVSMLACAFSGWPRLRPRIGPLLDAVLISASPISTRS